MTVYVVLFDKELDEIATKLSKNWSENVKQDFEKRSK